jgi:DNA-directed RNA polymerase specialized sigma24 family protein
VPELGCHSDEEIESTADILCEQYLPGVLRYVSYWVNDMQTAEDLTLKALKKSLAACKYRYKDENALSVGVFAAARKEVRDYLRTSSIKPALTNLSHREQDIVSLKLAAALNNRRISRIIGLPESNINKIIYQSLSKLKEYSEVPG